MAVTTTDAAPREWSRFKFPASLYRYFGLLFALCFIGFSIVYLNIPLDRFLGMFGRIGSVVADRYYPPDIEYVTDPSYLASVFETIQMAYLGALFGMLFALPLGWWLATTKAKTRPLFEAITALPLVLPPTVLGFYLLILMSPDTWIGGLFLKATGETLAFSFTGLVIASVIYSLPFAVQPMQTAFRSVPQSSLDAARTLGASARDAFFSTSLPLASRGVVTAAVLSFAHTVGEFGVVLMIGGNIPGETRVASIAIYDEVEALQYDVANQYALVLIAFAFLILTLVYSINRRMRKNWH